MDNVTRGQKIMTISESYSGYMCRSSSVHSTLSEEEHYIQRQPRWRHNVTCLSSSPGSEGEASVNDVLPAYLSEQPVQGSILGLVDKDNNLKYHHFLQKSQMICKAAVSEILMMASRANTWIKDRPDPDSITAELNMFHGPLPSGFKEDCSIASAVVPMTPADLISIMMNVELWASVLSRIVYRASCCALRGGLEQVSSISPDIQDMKMVNAEFHLPTPSVEVRRVRFLRYRMEAFHNVWVIVDMSDHYLFPTTLETSSRSECRKRPSGIIIGRCGENCSKVIWIENVEVYTGVSEKSICSSSISPMVYSASHWISMLLRRLKRNYSRFITQKIALIPEARGHLLNLAELMRKVFFECANGAPDETKWHLLSDGAVRILRSRTMTGSNIISASTNFVLQAKPDLVFHYLSENSQVLFHNAPKHLWESAELIRVATYDSTDYISLCKKDERYLLQEASSDDLCSFVVSAPMTQKSFDCALLDGQWRDIPLGPSGFTILPERSAGVQREDSRVTIAMNVELGTKEVNEVIQDITNFLLTLTNEIILELLPISEKATSMELNPLFYNEILGCSRLCTTASHVSKVGPPQHGRCTKKMALVPSLSPTPFQREKSDLNRYGLSQRLRTF